MSHEPPVPPGNQSPYPIQEPPHPPAAKTAAPPIEVRRGPSIGTFLGIAAGVGAAAIGIAALLFPRSSAAKPERKRRKR